MLVGQNQNRSNRSDDFDPVRIAGIQPVEDKKTNTNHCGFMLARHTLFYFYQFWIIFGNILYQCCIYSKTGNRTRHAIFTVSEAVFNFVILIQLPKFLDEICTDPLIFLPFFFCSCGCCGWSRTNTSGLLLTHSESSSLWWESSSLTLDNQKCKGEMT